MKKQRPPKQRSPVAKAVTRIRPQVIPDKRAAVLTREALKVAHATGTDDNEKHD